MHAWVCILVALGVVGVMSSNRQNYRISQGLAEMQENARGGFELLARDIRVARDTGCGPVPVATDALYAAPSAWWQTWLPVRGFAGVHCLGLLTSIFSAVVVSRAMVNLIY